MVFRLFAVALVAATAVPAFAFDGDPSISCRDALNQSDGIAPAVDWVAGYIAGRTRIAAPANRMAIDTAIAAACVLDRQRPLAEVAEELAVAALARLPFLAPGTAEGATAMLRAFYDPTADRRAITDALRPTPEEIALVYSDPLAGLLVPYIADIFGRGEQIAPGPEQTDVLVVHASTDQLIAGDAIARSFPGGYDKVRRYLRPGLPIVRFAFVAEGSGSGKSYDGLIHVRGHWVLIPKPWNVLPPEDAR